jgi:hypothetical protein
MNKSCLNQTAATVKLPTSPYSCLETKAYRPPKRLVVSASKISDKRGKMLHSEKNAIDRALPFFDF